MSISLNSIAQKERKLYFGLHFNGTQETTPRIKSIEGNQELKPAYVPSFEYGINLNYRIKEKNIISIKYTVGKYRHAYQYEIAASDNPFADHATSDKSWSQGPSYRKLTLTYERELWSKPKQSVNIIGGFSLATLPYGTETYSHELIDANQDTATVFYMHLENFNEKLRYSAVFGAAYYMSLFKKKDLRFSLDYNYCFSKIESGSYVFWPDYESYSYGTYTVRGHMITLGVSYLFTGKKKE